MSCKIQIALDTLDESHALHLAEVTHPYIDILEAGTPLIKSVGIKIVSSLKNKYPDKLVLADMKSSDVGAYEAEMAFKAGADIVTTQGITTLATIESVHKEAERWGRRCEVDMTGVSDIVARTKQLMDSGINLILFHRSIDEETHKGAAWDSVAFHTLEQLCNLGIDVGVAGGISLTTLPSLLQYPLFSIVIGRGITAQSDPGAAARAIAQSVRKESS